MAKLSAIRSCLVVIIRAEEIITRLSFRIWGTIRNHIKPGLGAIKLEALTTQDIQEFYNGRQKGDETREPLAPKTIKNIHGVLHKALEQAMLNGLIRNNPADPCVLPRRPKQKVKPLNEVQITKLIKALKGHKYENLILTTLFTGLREGEVCGLQWDCVNLETGTILVDKQLQSLRKSVRGNGDKYALVPTKNGKERHLTILRYNMAIKSEGNKDKNLSQTTKK